MSNFAGYRLRSFQPSNLIEIERMNLMYFHPAVMEAKGYASKDPRYGLTVDLLQSHSEMFSTPRELTRKPMDLSYAIADQSNHLIGWIWFYMDKSHPLPVQVSKELGLTPSNSRIYQMSYEKLMSDGWPEEIVAKLKHVQREHLCMPRKGVVVEGLRLAIKRLRGSYRKLYSANRKLVLYGFVHPDNIASQKVLVANGFEQAKRSYKYDGVPHELWVRVV